MKKYQSAEARESFVGVVKRYSPLLVLALALLGATIWYLSSISGSNLKKDELHGEAIPPTIVPVVFEEEEKHEGELGIVLEETAAVDDDYFADAVFVGDSLTTGFYIYEICDVNVIAVKGVNPQSALTYEYDYLLDGEQRTMIEAINYLEPRKIYIMLGSNGLNWQTPEWLAEQYEIFVDEVQRANPDSYIIIQSIFSVAEGQAAVNSNQSLENSDRYNALLREMALRKGYFFLDTNSSLRADNGYLLNEIAAPDGVHLSKTGYMRWYEYLKSHTIKGESAFMIDQLGRLSVAVRDVELT